MTEEMLLRASKEELNNMLQSPKPGRKPKIYKLYELPQRSGIRIYGLKYSWGRGMVLIFDHIDGAYSYCTILNRKKGVVHLSASTPLMKYGKGYKIIIE